jgi:cephalosporin-C deacetylase-like acetyl esterase
MIFTGSVHNILDTTTYFAQEVEKTVWQVRDKKATEDNEVPGYELKFLGEDGHRIMTKLITPYLKLGSS